MSDARERSLPADLRELAEDARAFAEAELAYQKSRAAYAGDASKRIAISGTLAAVFAYFAMVALVVGAVIALGPVLTPWGATAVVTGTLLLLAGLCAAVALKRMKQMKATLTEGVRD